MKPSLKKILKLITIVLLPIALQGFASIRNERRIVKDIFVDHQELTTQTEPNSNTFEASPHTTGYRVSFHSLQ